MERSFEETVGEAKAQRAGDGSNPGGDETVTPEPSSVEGGEAESTLLAADEVAPTGAPELGEAVARFDARLEESQRLLARQSDLVDRLHAENLSLRAGELRDAQLPLVRDLIRLHDDVGRMRAVAGEGDDDLRVVQESLLDTLARNGVEAYAPGNGEEFDPRLHAAAGTEPTTDESLDKTVVEIVRWGFQWESGDVIRVAEVRAYRYRDAT